MESYGFLIVSYGFLWNHMPGVSPIDSSTTPRGRWTSSTRSLVGCPDRSALPECGRQQEGAEKNPMNINGGFLSKYDEIISNIYIS